MTAPALAGGASSPVRSGWAVGGVSGWYAHRRDVPILIELLPNGIQVGYRKQF